MIVVLGRPALGPSLPAPAAGQGKGLAGLSAAICVAASAAGAKVELVGSVGDDAAGDEVIIRLARAGVGHAAVLRDPSARTGVVGPDSLDDGDDIEPVDGGLEMSGREPRLDAEDVGLGLGYLLGYGVLVIAERLPQDVMAVALEAARYHQASVVAVVPEGEGAGLTLGEDATVLEAPREAGAAFTGMVGRFVAALDAGVSAADAFSAATKGSGWEAAAE
ncbi:hypothetical protein BH18CHL1_BH18CHL1_06740 [soil metagenome]